MEGARKGDKENQQIQAPHTHFNKLDDINKLKKLRKTLLRSDDVGQENPISSTQPC